MVQKLSNKLICILLTVIIIFNTFLPSVCYGEDTFNNKFKITNGYVCNYSEKIDLNQDNFEWYVDGSIRSFMSSYINDDSIFQYEYQDGIAYDDELIRMTHSEIDTISNNDSEAAKKVINNGKNLLYDMIIILNELKKEECNYKIYNLPEDVKAKYDNMISDIRYYYLMQEHFGAFGAYTYLELLRLIAEPEQNENYEWVKDYDGTFYDIFGTNSNSENEKDRNIGRRRFLSDMEVSYRETYKNYIESYYTTTQESSDDEIEFVQDDDINQDITPSEIENNEQNAQDEIIDGAQEIAEENNEQAGTSKSLILGFLDYALGILLYVPKIIILVTPLLIQSILSLLVSGGQGEWAWVSIEQILFNKLTITNINFFSKITAGGEEISNVFLKDIRGYVSNWYYAFRNLAIILYLCILIYIGIRMAISSISEDKAKYKAMLTNWLVGLGIVFVLQYIIIIIINANELLVSAIDPKGIDGRSIFEELFEQIFWLSFTTSFGSLIIYTILMILTFIFFLIYLKRMITIAFLIIISPLITLTYPIDKASDNKSQILNSWLGEFVSDVLIQFFHCAIYVIFVQTSMETLASSSGQLNFGVITVAIVCTCSIFYAEKILKQLFGLNRGGSTFLRDIVMGKVLTKVIDNAKVIRGSKNDKQNIDVPDNMPDGEDTQQAAINLNNPKLDNKLEHEFETEKEENGSKTNNSSGKKTNIFQKGAKAYLGGIDLLAKNTILGYGAARKAYKNRYTMKTKDVQKLFNEALTRYAPPEENMTKEQFLLRMQALKNTDINKITQQSDLQMKTWMMALQQSYANDGRINPEMLLDKTIKKYADNNFNG